MSLKTTLAQATPYITKDGSEIRELVRPELHGNTAQSLAEATIFPQKGTMAHRHLVTEEIYHVIHGQGIVYLDGRAISVSIGDSVIILPNQVHSVKNTGSDNLRILCCCSPAYTHDDTLLEKI